MTSTNGLRAIVLGAVLALAGCFGGASTPTSQYALAPRPEPAAQTAASGSLGVFDLEYARYYKNPMMARVGDFELVALNTDVWAELPSETLTRALVDSFGASGLFGTVAKAVELQRPDWVLSGEVRRFEWLRATAPGSALCEVALELRPRGQDTPFIQLRLTEEVPLDDDTPNALAAAMQHAIETIAERAVAEAADRVE